MKAEELPERKVFSMMQIGASSTRRRWGVAVLTLVLALALEGCSVAERLGKSDTAPVAAAAPATPIPTPSPVVFSTPANTGASAESAVAGSGTSRRLSTTNMTYNGEIMAEAVVPVVAQVAGQIQEVKIAVGDSVKMGDPLVRIDSTVAEAQRAQAQAALELAQSQLELAKTQPKKTDLDAAQAAVSAARAAYNRALQGATEEEKRMALAQLKQAEAAVSVYQGQYDRISGNPFAGMMLESLQLQQATLAKEAAQAQYDKVLKGATADQIAAAYAALTGAQSQLARLQRGAEPAQIKAAEAGVKQAEAAVYLAQLQLDKASVPAPADGFVYKLDAVEGGMAGPGTALAVIFSHDAKIVIQVEESRFGDVSVGQPVTIRVDAYPDRSFDGEVSEIAPTFDYATRTVQVTVRPIGDAGADLKPGMFATVTLAEK
jgi:HlyD family secretion protein